MKERNPGKEKTNWWGLGGALAGFIAGLAIIQENLVTGTVVLLGSWWIWNHSHRTAAA